MAVDTIRLWSLGVIKDWYGTSQSGKDTQIEQIADGVAALLERETRRIYVQRTIIEVRDGDGTARLWLRQFPVVSIASITVLRNPTDSTPETILTADYRFSADMGRIEAHGDWFTKGMANVTVTYDARYATQDGAAFTSVPDAEQTWHAAYLLGFELIKIIAQETFSGASAASSIQIGPASFIVKPDWPKHIKMGFDNLRRLEV